MKRIENVKEMIPGKNYLIDFEEENDIITFKSINYMVLEHDKVFKKDFTEEDMLEVTEWYINIEQFEDDLGMRIDFYEMDIYEL